MEKNSNIRIVPENFSELKAQKQSQLSSSFLRYALILLLGGIGSYGWWLYQDFRYLGDGTNATGRVVSSSSQTSSRKGKTYLTQTIQYSYEVAGGGTQKGKDYVKTWRHKPTSQTAYKPKVDDEIVVEYLKSSPADSRIVIPNRYSNEYLLSIIAVIGGICFFLVRFIYGQPTPQRLRYFGGLLILIGLAIAAGTIYMLMPSKTEYRQGGEFLVMLFVFLFFFGPFFIYLPLWFGWFLISQSRMNVDDPCKLIDSGLIPACEGRTSIMPRGFLGTPAAMVLDHETQSIHFINCHVKKGFIPWVKPVYSCKVTELERSEKTYSNKRGQDRSSDASFT